jgi:hydroxymethylglutaryl-CoA synthase
MRDPSKSWSIGIDSIAVAVPRAYLDLRDLAAARGVAPSKYLSGLGVEQMAVAAPDEDPVVLAVSAAHRALAGAGVAPSEIGMCVTGTETAVDHSKPVAAFVHGLLGLSSSCRTFETKHACFGGTAGLLGALEWIASGAARGRAALVVCTDIARYGLGTAGEPTQGAGAVALVVRERPRLVALEVGANGSYTRDVYDFWRPLDRKEALVDGHFSVACYLDALQGAYEGWLAQGGAEGGPLARTCYHVPYGKMAIKAHRRRKQIDGLSESEADASFAIEVAPSLILPSRIGNVYTGSLYLALASLLHAEAKVLEGERIGLFSYGSGCAAEFFAGRVQEGAASFVEQLRIDEPLAARRRLDMAEYEAIRRGDVAADRRRAEREAAPGQAAEGSVAFLGIDPGERRVYGVA